MRRIKIIGYGTYLPENKIMFDDQVRYRCSKDVSMIDMAEAATKEALVSSGLTMKDIDLILYGGAVCAQLIPASATLLHERLAKGLGIPAFDVNSSCSSFITALDIASLYIEAGQYKNILVIGCDKASVGLNEEQKESYELFSDGAAAVIVTKSELSQGVVATLQKTYSEGAHATEIRGGGSLKPSYEFKEEDLADYLFDMKGRAALFSMARYLPGVFNSFMEENHLSLDDIDLIIPHQASKALSMFMSRMNIPQGKYMDCVSQYGNMVSASVPFLLCKALKSGKIGEGSTVLLCGTAAGLTINLMLLQL